MTWFFAILIVLALGGIAAVAAGRGAPLEEVYDDRPDADVPADGPLGAEDLRRLRFSIALRGYRMSEVDALRERLAAERETGPDDGPGTGPAGDHAGGGGPGPAPGAPEGRGGAPAA
jgi:DivIVA domain-containing protein